MIVCVVLAFPDACFSRTSEATLIFSPLCEQVRVVIPSRLGGPGAAPAVGLYRLAGEQGATTLGRPSVTLVKRTIGALAARLRIGGFAGIAYILERLSRGVIRGQ